MIVDMEDDAFKFDLVDRDDSERTIIWRPWTDGHAVGFSVTRRDGKTQIIYLNPSMLDGDEGEPCAFVYVGDGEPASDPPYHYYNIFEN